MAGLNPSEIVEIVDIIRKIRDSGVTVLLIEHVMQAVMSLSEHLYVLSYGRIIADGAPRDVVREQMGGQTSGQTSGQDDGQALPQGAPHA
jgi:branched-chain amino acid transport system ATP-binding protein